MKTVRLLIVDDVAADRELLNRYFSPLCQEVVQAESGAQALAMLGKHAFDVVLLDVAMPDLDGFQVLKKIRANPKLAGVQVVMVTGVGSDDDVVRALELGAVDYITKPLHLEVARARLSVHIARKQAEDASRADREDLEFTIRQLKKTISETEEAMKAKADFLANVSHEIRTPLNGILGIAGVLALDSLTPRQAEMVGIIQQSGTNLERLLSDLLDSQRLEAGQLQLSSEPYRIRDLVSHSVQLFTAAAAKKGISLEVEIDPAAPSEATGDPGRVQQILNNLIGNAVKFTQAGGVRCVVLPGAIPGAYAVEVRDTGMGFDPAKAETLFERFRQADGSINRRHGGTGLGLPISRDLAKLMGGSLSATSTPGEGSTFSLVLPCDQAPAPAEVAEEPQLPAAPIRVLVVDDNAVNRCVLELMLGPTGCEVIAAENGAHAVDAVEHEHFDLILMDLQMPVMDGLTAIREIRRRDPSHPPIIVVSANGRPQGIRDCLAAGAVSYLTKPVNVGELMSAVASAVQSWPEAQRIAAA